MNEVELKRMTDANAWMHKVVDYIFSEDDGNDADDAVYDALEAMDKNTLASILAFSVGLNYQISDVMGWQALNG